MKMRALILSVAFGVFTTVAFADQTLTDQVNSVHAIEVEQQRIEQLQAEARQEEYARQVAKENAQREKAQRAQAAAVAAKASEQKADKVRDQTYEDKLRDLEIQQRMIALQKEQKRANREDDFIDQELNMKKSQADLVQSGADATRNVSSGAKSLMEDTGKAKVKESSGWFW